MTDLTDLEKKMLNAILDMLIAIDPDTPEEIDKELREMGYDPDKVEARIKKFIQVTLDE